MSRREVEQGKSSSAKFPHSLETDGVGECLAIGLLNVKTGIGYLMHDDGQNVGSIPKIEAMIKEAIGDSDPHEVIVGLAGNRPLNREFAEAINSTFEECLRHTNAFGEKVFALLKSSGIPESNIDDQLVKNPQKEGLVDEAYKMVVSTQKNKISIKKKALRRFYTDL